MADARIDTLAREIASPMPRRRVLKGLAALALGGGVAVAAERLRSAEARPMDGCHRYPDGSKVCCYPDGNCYRQGPGGD